MDYEWDDAKAKANLIRHNVNFSSVIEFDWDSAIGIFDDRVDYGEERWIAFGLIRNKLHTLVYTLRSENIRIISLRKATKKERQYYEKKAG